MLGALEQDTFPDHARCPGDDGVDFHEVFGAEIGRSDSRSTSLARPSAV
jgi:hypothetical protein